MSDRFQGERRRDNLLRSVDRKEVALVLIDEAQMLAVRRPGRGKRQGTATVREPTQKIRVRLLLRFTIGGDQEGFEVIRGGLLKTGDPPLLVKCKPREMCFFYF
jgi:hypothetical protein